MENLVKKFYVGKGRSYANGWAGPIGIAAGLESLEAGECAVAKFMVADHHRDGDKVYARYEVTRVTEPSDSFRYSDGGGESRLSGPSIVEAAATLAYLMTSSKCQAGLGIHIYREVPEFMVA